jgi:hypothetical protein
MATILAFTPRKTASGAFPGTLAKAGDVIIFPGVRYEQTAPALQRGDTARVEGDGSDGGGPQRH